MRRTARGPVYPLDAETAAAAWGRHPGCPPQPWFLSGAGCRRAAPPPGCQPDTSRLIPGYPGITLGERSEQSVTLTDLQPSRLPEGAASDRGGRYLRREPVYTPGAGQRPRYGDDSGEVGGEGCPPRTWFSYRGGLTEGRDAPSAGVSARRTVRCVGLPRPNRRSTQICFWPSGHYIRRASVYTPSAEQRPLPAEGGDPGPGRV